VTLLAIKDDFLDRTLVNVPGLLGKLEYVAGLREEGRYVHWGLERIYGEEITQRTMSEVHRALFLQVLRTPLRRLLEDVSRAAVVQQFEIKDYLGKVLREPPRLVPANLGGGSATHFNSVVEALWSLLR
jgi:hypothetical protein